MPTGNRISFAERKNIVQESDDLFRSTAQSFNADPAAEISKTNDSYDQKIKDSAHTDHELKRQTYYLSPDIIEALDAMSFATKTDKSKLVRELLSSSELQKYFGFKDKFIV